MKRAMLVLGIVFLLLSLVVLGFAEGARRIYSGGFFLLLGVILLLEWRWSGAESDSSDPTRADEPSLPADEEPRE